jgi:hypothetical protein
MVWIPARGIMFGFSRGPFLLAFAGCGCVYRVLVKNVRQHGEE